MPPCTDYRIETILTHERVRTSCLTDWSRSISSTWTSWYSRWTSTRCVEVYRKDLSIYLSSPSLFHPPVPRLPKFHFNPPRSFSCFLHFLALLAAFICRGRGIRPELKINSQVHNVHIDVCTGVCFHEEANGGDVFSICSLIGRWELWTSAASASNFMTPCQAEDSRASMASRWGLRSLQTPP